MNLKQIREDLAQGEGLHCEFKEAGNQLPRVTNINKYLPLYAKGAKPVFRETLHGFELTIPLATQHESQQGTGQTTPTEDTKLALSGHQVKILHNCLMERALVELMQIEGRSDRTKFRNQVLNPLLDAGLIEMTLPDKPRSSLQKYRLAAKGKQLRKTL